MADQGGGATEMLKDLAAGTNGGFAITAVGHPFDTIKIRMQTQPVDNPLYSGTWDCMKKTLKWEGVGGLYRGVTSPLVGNAFFNATQFLAYGQAKKLFRPDGNEDAMTVTQFLGCGIMTGTLVSFVESPIDLFKSQMQVQIFRSRITGEPPAYRSVPDVVRQVVSGYGLRGFYQGLSATMCRDIPAVSLYFSTYEATRKALVKEGESVSDLPSWKLLAAGGVGGFFYWSLTYPMDVIKSTLQSDSIHPTERRFNGIADCARKLYAQGGARRLTVGIVPCLLRSIPGNAACFYAYEKTRQYLG